MKEKLTYDQAMLHALMESSIDSIYFKDTEGRFTRISMTLADRFDPDDPEKAIGKMDSDFHTKEHARQAFQDEQRVMKSGQPLMGIEEKETWPDGRETWVSTSKMPLRDKAGKTIGIIGIARDITDRKRAEEALEESEKVVRQTKEELERVLNTMGDGLMVLDSQHRLVKANRRICEMLQCTEEELFGKDHTFWCHPDSLNTMSEELERRRRGELTTYEAQFIGKNGSWFYGLVTGTAILDEEGNYEGAIGCVKDITERKRIEKSLIRLERLRALWEMSAGISHSLNNILTTILTPAQILQRITDDPAILRETETICSSVLRAKHLVQRLQRCTRDVEEEERQPVQVDEVIREVVQVTRPRWKDESESKGVSIEVVTDLGGGPPIRGMQSGFYDMLTNLLFNAVDAIRENGMIAIQTRAVDETVQVTVSDTGIGMDEETRRRVFEPFFTTKKEVGIGLGLSTVYRTVVQWGGDIEVESEPGKGSTFVIQLPVWTGPEKRKCDRPGRSIARCSD